MARIQEGSVIGKFQLPLLSNQGSKLGQTLCLGSKADAAPNEPKEVLVRATRTGEKGGWAPVRDIEELRTLLRSSHSEQGRDQLGVWTDSKRLWVFPGDGRIQNSEVKTLSDQTNVQWGTQLITTEAGRSPGWKHEYIYAGPDMGALRVNVDEAGRSNLEAPLLCTDLFAPGDWRDPIDLIES